MPPRQWHDALSRVRATATALVEASKPRQITSTEAHVFGEREMKELRAELEHLLGRPQARLELGLLDASGGEQVTRLGGVDESMLAPIRVLLERKARLNAIVAGELGRKHAERSRGR